MIVDRFGVPLEEGKPVALDLSTYPFKMIDGIITNINETGLTADRNQPPIKQVVIFTQMVITLPIQASQIPQIILFPMPPDYPLAKALGIQAAGSQFKI